MSGHANARLSRPLPNGHRRVLLFLPGIELGFRGAWVDPENAREQLIAVRALIDGAYASTTGAERSPKEES